MNQQTQTPSGDALDRMVERCDEYWLELVSEGCDSDIALDRTFDAMRAALGEVEHAFDKRDRLFENELRTIAAERQ